MYTVYSRPFAAQAYYLLGDYETTLRMLEEFQPSALQTGGFDSRWGMIGRVRLLRGAAYERLGPAGRGTGGVPPGSGPVEGRPIQPCCLSSSRRSEGLARVGTPG